MASFYTLNRVHFQYLFLATRKWCARLPLLLHVSEPCPTAFPREATPYFLSMHLSLIQWLPLAFLYVFLFYIFM